MEETDVKPTIKLAAISLLGIAIAPGCASNEYRSVEAGVVAIGKMRVTLGSGWKKVRDAEIPEKQFSSSVYSRDGLEHDRLILIAGIDEGQTIFRDETIRGLPKFRTEMTVSEVADLVAASLQAALWEGGALVQATSPRAPGFVGVPGFKFELEVDIPGAANQRGMAGGFIHEERLYVNIFVAEAPGYYERHKQVAQEVIDSAVPTIKTIRMSALSVGNHQALPTVR
jgi:hypothetical protein